MNPDLLCMGCMREKGPEVLCLQCGWRDGSPAESPLQLAPRTALQGRYLLGRVLGQGGFGITYLAWDLIGSRKLAIKEYFPLAISTRAEDRITVSPISAKSRPDLEYGLRKFAEEGQALARFKDRPGIVSMLEFLYANGTAYIAMAYVEGRTFKQYLQERGGRISFEAALKVMALVMNALEEVHAAGMLHRDISPDNIYVEEDGQTKILDFGATRFALGEQSQSLSVILKPGYAPEEQYRSKGRQGAWTDIYSLAATFYRALTGHPPPEAPDRLAHDELVPPSRYGIRMPPRAETALLKALAVRAENRFKTVPEFRKAVGAPAESPRLPSEVPDPALRQQSQGVRHEKLSKAFFLLSIAGGLGLSIVCGLLTDRPDDTLSGLRAIAFLYAVVVTMVLLHRLWLHIQDGHARMSPGQAIGFLFIPVFNLYWLIQVFWGFSRDYNHFIDRHSLSHPKLPEPLFLASNVAFLALAFTFWVPYLSQAISVMSAFLLCLAVSKACDAVNALKANAPGLSDAQRDRRMVTLAARRTLLRCISGEFQGDDLELENGEVFIGRNPKQVNWVFSSDEVSGRHVRVWRDPTHAGVWVEDMNSTNGTYYREAAAANTQWIRLSAPRMLPSGSRFRLGQDLAEFEVKTV